MSVNVTSIKFGVYSIRDVKTDSFMTPFFQTHKPAAMRAFSDLCTDPNSLIAKHPADFSLYCVGEYVPETGTLIPLSQPEYLAQATDFLQ